MTKTKVEYKGFLSKMVNRPNVTKLKFVTKSELCCALYRLWGTYRVSLIIEAHEHVVFPY